MDQGQPKTSARGLSRRFCLHPIEFAEDPLSLGVGHARAVVLHLDEGMAVLGPGPYDEGLVQP